MMDSTRPDNPFPAQAVTTFGVPTTRVAELRAIRLARDQLTEHLKAWPQKGAAVAISGAHGGGKTFLFEQLASHLQGQTRAAPQVVYVKADNSSFTDLYRLILGKLSRTRLLEVVDLAIRRRALMITGAAKGTLAAQAEIEKTGQVDSAYRSSVLDPNVMKNWLRSELEAASGTESVAQRVASAIGLLDDPTYGNAAYNWLETAAPTPSNVPALPNSALAAPLLGPPGAESADTAIAALECIAKLHWLAERPLVLMVDQMEMLLGVNTDVDNSSYLKKFVEQLKARQAILVLAGTPMGWRRLPVDVGPRLWEGDALEVGGLELDEMAGLVRAFPAPSPYSEPMLGALRTLTGGNPRAVLQTSYQAFERTQGDLAQVDEALLRVSAAAAGMLRDRSRVATDLLVQLARESGFEVQPAFGDGVTNSDRLLVAPGGRSLLAVVIVLPDSVTEATEASRLATLRGDLARREPPTGLLVIAVGYSSDTIQSLLAPVVDAIIPYNEASYPADLQPVFRRLAEPAPAAALAAALPSAAAGPLPATPEPSPPPPLTPDLAAELDRLQGMISEVKGLRIAANTATSERIVSNIAQTAEPEIQKGRAETRQEMRDGVESLADLSLRGAVEDERTVIRRLLIANEGRVQLEAFDLLGGFYLEAVDELRRRLVGRDAAEADRARTDPKLRALGRLRHELIQAMRATLSGTAGHWFLTEPLRSISVVVVGLIAAVYAFVLFRNTLFFRYFGSELFFLGAVLGFGAVVAALFVAALEFWRRPQLRYRRFARQLAWVRK